MAKQMKTLNGYEVHDEAAHRLIEENKILESGTNGNIKVGDSEITVYRHPGEGTNPHGTSKSDIGLENVENKSSKTIREELTKSDIERALGYTPGTGSSSTLVSMTDNPNGGINLAVDDKRETLAKQSDLNKKQEKLIAGNNITIDPDTNIISSTGSGSGSGSSVTMNDNGTSSITLTVDGKSRVLQKKLTAGKNISIDEDNVISSSGSIDAYIKSASVTGNTLTLIPNEGNDIVFTPTGGGGGTGGSTVTITDNSSGGVNITVDSTTKTLAKQSDLNNKVDKATGKVLSSNDFTNEYKNKIDGIASGATKVEKSDTAGNIKINGTEVTIGGSGGGYVVSSEIPSDATKLWINSSNGAMYYCNNGSWYLVKATSVWG